MYNKLMNKLLFVAIEVSLVSLLTSTTSSPILSRHEPECKNMRVILVDKPQELEFLECKKTKEMQLNVLEARYRVPGKDAARVEKFLQQKFNMSQLRFLCCGWEPIAVIKQQNQLGRGSYRDNFGYQYEITMFSEETLVYQRQEWKNIPFFYVTVTKFLESP